MPKGRKARGKVVERQVAALPLRLTPEGRIEVLLITSRETGRWVIPKGNPMKGRKRREVAGIEAHEEAGIAGTVEPGPWRSFEYWKRRDDGFVLCRVAVFLMLVNRMEPDWKEATQRQRMWLPARIAARLVLEPGLQALIEAVAEDPIVHERLGEYTQDLSPASLDVEPDVRADLLGRVVGGPWRLQP